MDAAEEHPNTGDRALEACDVTLKLRGLRLQRGKATLELGRSPIQRCGCVVHPSKRWTTSLPGSQSVDDRPDRARDEADDEDTEGDPDVRGHALTLATAAILAAATRGGAVR